MAEYYEVTATMLNVRASPGLDAPLVGRMDKGTLVVREVGGQEDDWWYIKIGSGDLEGFVARKYLAAADNIVADKEHRHPATLPATLKTGQRPAFSGRGFFCYLAKSIGSKFGSTEAAVAEMKRCGLNHLWVRIHGINYIGDSRNGDLRQQKQLVNLARKAGIAVAGWGWCQGSDPLKEARLALASLEEFGLDDYVADIEQGVSNAKWTQTEVLQFIKEVRPKVKGLCISSHGFIDYQEPKIFNTAAPFVDCLNPQSYWFTDKPNRKMLKFVKASDADYPLRDPAAYVRLCYDRWTSLYGRPLVLSGHTAPEGDMQGAEATTQLRRFLSGFKAPDGLVGLNYWHWGATVKAQRDLLAAAPGSY